MLKNLTFLTILITLASHTQGQTPIQAQAQEQSLTQSRIQSPQSLLATIRKPKIQAPQLPDTATTIQSKPSLTISGSADIYYRYDLARNDKNNFTSFTNTHNQFQLGMANIRLEHKTAKVDLVADLAVGPREKAFAYNDKGVSQAIKQLYISYNVNKWLKLTAGAWATHLCYEVPDAPANRNYSMSYLFTNGPFSHTGVKADMNFGKSSFMIGIANPSDYRAIPDDGHANKNILAQYSYAPNDNLKFSANYVGGRDIEDNRTHQYDFVMSAKTSSLFSLGFNASLNRSSLASEKYAISHSWWGGALYLNLDPRPWFGLTLRSEYFNDEKDTRLPAPASIVANTLSANFRIDGFTFIPEFRVENANTPIYTRHDGTPTYAAASFVFAAIYSF